MLWLMLDALKLSQICLNIDVIHLASKSRPYCIFVFIHNILTTKTINAFPFLEKCVTFAARYVHNRSIGCPLTQYMYNKHWTHLPVKNQQTVSSYSMIFYISTHKSTLAYSYSSAAWQLVFRGLSGVGTDMYTAFYDGTDSVTDDVTCMTLDDTVCAQHFRSPVINSWAGLGISQVNLYMYLVSHTSVKYHIKRSNNRTKQMRLFKLFEN